MAGWWGWTLRVMHDRWSTTAHHIVVGPLIATTTSCTAAPTLVPKFDKLVSYTGLHFLSISAHMDLHVVSVRIVQPPRLMKANIPFLYPVNLVQWS